MLVQDENTRLQQVMHQQCLVIKTYKDTLHQCASKASVLLHALEGKTKEVEACHAQLAEVSKHNNSLQLKIAKTKCLVMDRDQKCDMVE